MLLSASEMGHLDVANGNDEYHLVKLLSSLRASRRHRRAARQSSSAACLPMRRSASFKIGERVDDINISQPAAKKPCHLTMPHKLLELPLTFKAASASAKAITQIRKHGQPECITARQCVLMILCSAAPPFSISASSKHIDRKSPSINQ